MKIDWQRLTAGLDLCRSAGDNSPGRLCIFALAAGLLLATAQRSSASTQIILLSDRDKPFYPKIYVMDTNGSNVRRLGTLPGCYSYAEFSPDNRKILFSYSEEILSPKHFYVMNSDGSDPRVLTPPPGSKGAPHFGSDGRIVYDSDVLPGSADAFNEIAMGPHGMIAFIRHATVNNIVVPQIFTMTATGTGLTQITNVPESLRWPGWCSDGRKIAYANTGLTEFPITPRHEHDGIYIMNADGSHPVRIVEIDFSRELPRTGPDILSIGSGREVVSLSSALSFSPDCRTLAYSVNLNGKSQIYVVNADGTGLKRLTEPPSRNSWSSFSH
jgi:Tol biopolymer transport system component